MPDCKETEYQHLLSLFLWYVKVEVKVVLVLNGYIIMNLEWLCIIDNTYKKIDSEVISTHSNTWTYTKTLSRTLFFLSDAKSSQ